MLDHREEEVDVGDQREEEYEGEVDLLAEEFGGSFGEEVAE